MRPFAWEYVSGYATTSCRLEQCSVRVMSFSLPVWPPGPGLHGPAAVRLEGEAGS